MRLSPLSVYVDIQLGLAVDLSSCATYTVTFWFTLKERKLVPVEDLSLFAVFMYVEPCREGGTEEKVNVLSMYTSAPF
jgi:hypothetical protein